MQDGPEALRRRRSCATSWRQRRAGTVTSWKPLHTQVDSRSSMGQMARGVRGDRAGAQAAGASKCCGQASPTGWNPAQRDILDGSRVAVAARSHAGPSVGSGPEGRTLVRARAPLQTQEGAVLRGREGPRRSGTAAQGRAYACWQWHATPCIRAGWSACWDRKAHSGGYNVQRGSHTWGPGRVHMERSG